VYEIALYPGAACDPQREADVKRTISKSLRNPLDEQAMRTRHAIELFAESLEFSSRE
jgi:hypothetical protein